MADCVDRVKGPRAARYARWVLAVVLTPLTMAVWLGGSLGVVMVCLGGRPGDIARLMLAMFVVMVGFVLPFACVLFLGLPYSIVMSRRGDLNWRTFLLGALPVAVIYGLVVYSSLSPDRYPTFAVTMALAAMPEVLLASLCFYFIGFWCNTSLGR